MNMKLTESRLFLTDDFIQLLGENFLDDSGIHSDNFAKRS